MNGAAGERYLFYRLAPGDERPMPVTQPHDVQVRIWRPSWAAILPHGVPAATGAVWWAMERLRLFRNRDYAQLLIYVREHLVHRSGVYPGWQRFPFMAPADLQIGDTWTDPSWRGRGFASCGIAHIVSRFSAPGRHFWYITSSLNGPSIRAIERAGFSLAASGRRTRRLGLALLGAYVPEPAGRT